jgi:hypothetical protein
LAKILAAETKNPATSGWIFGDAALFVFSIAFQAFPP